MEFGNQLFIAILYVPFLQIPCDLPLGDTNYVTSKMTGKWRILTNMPFVPTMTYSAVTIMHSSPAWIANARHSNSGFGSAIFSYFIKPHWAHLDSCSAKPAILDPVVNPLAGVKGVKLDSAQRRLAESKLCSVIPTYHPFLLVAIDVPDHSLHRSNSSPVFLCVIRNSQRGEARKFGESRWAWQRIAAPVVGPFALAPASRRTRNRGPLLRPRIARRTRAG